MPNSSNSCNMKRAGLYVRVSTTNRATSNQAVLEQSPEVRERPLRQLAEQRGWNVVQVYSDRTSGSKADRPHLKALMRDARRGTFDVVLVWRFDRSNVNLARSGSSDPAMALGLRESVTGSEPFGRPEFNSTPSTR